VEPASFGAETILIKPVPAATLVAAVGRCFGIAPVVDLAPLPPPGPRAPSPDLV
jgi:hypothetical protein